MAQHGPEQHSEATGVSFPKSPDPALTGEFPHHRQLSGETQKRGQAGRAEALCWSFHQAIRSTPGDTLWTHIPWLCLTQDSLELLHDTGEDLGHCTGLGIGADPPSSAWPRFQLACLESHILLCPHVRTTACGKDESNDN